MGRNGFISPGLSTLCSKASAPLGLRKLSCVGCVLAVRSGPLCSRTRKSLSSHSLFPPVGGAMKMSITQYPGTVSLESAEPTLSIGSVNDPTQPTAGGKQSRLVRLLGEMFPEGVPNRADYPREPLRANSSSAIPASSH